MTLAKVRDLAQHVREQQIEPIHKPLKPDVVVVEEAGQILEAHICNAIAVMPERARLIQIGDHMQLPATCRSIENKANSYDRSQFERLFLNSFVECTMLRVQHRMVPIISAYPSEAFYGSALIDAVCASRPPINFPYASQPKSMVFFNVDAEEEEKTRKSYWYSSEVDAVLKVVKSLLQKKRTSKKKKLL